MFTRYVQTIRLDSCVTPLPLSRRLWRKLSGQKLESTTENFHKNFTFKKFTFHHMKVTEWLKMYSISQSYISPPIIVSLIQILQRTWCSPGFSLKRTKAQSQQCSLWQAPHQFLQDTIFLSFCLQHWSVLVENCLGNFWFECLAGLKAFSLVGGLTGLKACRRKGENFVCWLNFRVGRGGWEMIYSMFQCLKENWNCILDIKK